MNITSEKKGKAEIKMRVELAELDLEKYRGMALQKLAGQINVKGFRPGKIPLEVVKENVDPKYLASYTIEMAIAPTYMEGIKEQKIEPIGRPTVTVISETPLVYEAIIPVYPQVHVKDYQKIKVEAHQVVVSEADQEVEIKRFQAMHAIYRDVEREAKLGDRVEIDFNGFDEGGVPLDGTSSKNHPLVLGENTFVPGFEEQLVGLKKGEEKEISVTFPADYFHKPFQNKLVKFKVKLHRLEEREIPELNAELIKKITNKEMSLEQFRQELKENMIKAREEDDKIRIENEVLDQLEKRTEVELSHALIDEEIHYMIDEQKNELQERGISWEKYLEAVKKTEKDLHDEKHADAEKRLRLRFGVQEVFKEEKIEVSEAELNKAFDDEMKILEAMNYVPKVEEKEIFKTRMKNKLKMEKMINIFKK